jgi:hypothetical protein
LRDYIESQIKIIETKVKNEFTSFKGGPWPGQVQEYQYYMGKLSAFKDVLKEIK